ncbi:tyrosine-type recombinase/integrase [Flaviflexus massiliensis]|uniref:tyrosine-type recombinase/integrase n=1 Tax=Flaviflexus massiliensis TaxID=1522309 RepID=UPI0006D55064|nr:site-specific integrase [Flaviflexus massiliensis]
MANRRGFGNIYRAASGQYVARFAHPDKPYRDNGARNWVPAPYTFERKTEAQLWLDAQRTDIQRGVWKSPEQLVRERLEAEARSKRDSLSFGQYAEGWLIARKLTPATRFAYESNLRTHLLPRWEDVTLKTITTPEIRMWLAELAPNSPGARKKSAELFRTILNTAVDDELIPVNPYRRNMLGTVASPTPTRQVVKRQTRALSLAQLHALAHEVPDYLRTLVLLSGLCGLRSGEARELRGKDVQTADVSGTVYVSIVRAVSGQGKAKVVGVPKTEESIRVVAVPDQISGDVLELKERAGDEGLLFRSVTNPAEHIPETTYRLNMVRAGERLGIGPVSPHDLRRTMVTNAIDARVPLPDIQATVGHATASMTMRYARSSQERRDRAMLVMNEAYKNHNREASVSSLDERRGAWG